MRIIIRPSEIAAIVDRHRYKTRDEVFGEMWKRYSPENFKGETKDDRARVVFKNNAAASQIMQKTTYARPKNSDDVQKILSNATNEINATSLDSEQKKDAIEFVRKEVYTRHGTRSEDKTADAVEKTEKTTLNRDPSFYESPVVTIKDNNYVIVGKIDRVERKDDGSEILVEIKNRINRLFNSVPEYEEIQIQCYLQLLNLENARLIEQFNNQVMSHDIVRNEFLWNQCIFPQLLEFCEEFNEKVFEINNL
jgi:hypothetical protein